MLVVTNQHALRVGREGGLAGARKAKEHGRLTSGGVHVGRGVHGEHAFLNGHDVVHDREDCLLDLAGVLGAGNDDATVLEVDENRGLGVGAVLLGVQLEGRGSQHREVLDAIGIELAARGTHEELTREEGLAGALAHHEELAEPTAVGATNGTHNKQVALLQVVDDLFLDELVVLDREGLVDRAPGDVIVNIGRVNNEAVLGRSTSVLAGLDGKGTL